MGRAHSTHAMRNAYKILAGKPKEKRPAGRWEWEFNINNICYNWGNYKLCERLHKFIGKKVIATQ